MIGSVIAAPVIVLGVFLGCSGQHSPMQPDAPGNGFVQPASAPAPGIDSLIPGPAYSTIDSETLVLDRDLALVRHHEESLEQVEFPGETFGDALVMPAALESVSNLETQPDEDLPVLESPLPESFEVGASSLARDGYELVYLIDELPFVRRVASLGPEARSILDQLVARLRMEDGDYRLEIQGNTGAARREGAPSGLGRQRAESVRKYLTRPGSLAVEQVAAAHATPQQTPSQVVILVFRR